MITPAVQKRHRVQNLTQILFDGEESRSLHGHFIRGATGTFGLKVAVTGMYFIISLLLARLLGSTGYGNYSYAISWTVALGVPAGLGLNRLLVRNVAAYQVQSAWGLMAGLLRWANRAALLASLGIAILSAVALWFLRTHLDSQMLYSLWIALVLLPLTSLMYVRQAVMQGLNHVVVGQLPEMLFQPILFIALIGSAYLLINRSIIASWAMGMHVMAAGAALLISMQLLRKVLPQVAKSTPPQYEIRTWLSGALSIVFVGGMSVINSRADVLMLGVITGAEAVGVYNVATRGAELITFTLMPVHQALGPAIASLYAKDDIRQLQNIITKSIRLALLLSLPIALGLLVFGYRFLLLFGPDFTQGQTALAILSFGQLINVATGPVILLLIMTSHERTAAMGVGVGATLNVILNAILIPMWGLEGAAIATTSSTILWNILMVIWVYRRLGIHSTVLGRISFRDKYNLA